MDRYSRQTALPEIGTVGQQRLQAASVLVVGAGGLGHAVLQQLCGAGVGRIVIVDHDRIEETNLHRQPLFEMNDIGRHKAVVARDALLRSNPTLQIEAIVERLSPANVTRFVGAADVVIDAADSFAVTYTLSDACQRANRALVSASVAAMAGYVGAFCGGAPSYRAVFPSMPSRAGSCAQDGVIGTAVGVVGTLQAHVVLALLLRLEPSPLGRILSVDLAALRFSDFAFGSALEPVDGVAPFIAESQLMPADVVVDLRADHEAATSPFDASVQVGVEDIERLLERILPSQRVVLCCRSGIRAWRAAEKLRACGHSRLALIALGR